MPPEILPASQRRLLHEIAEDGGVLAGRESNANGTCCGSRKSVMFRRAAPGAIA